MKITKKTENVVGGLNQTIKEEKTAVEGSGESFGTTFRRAATDNYQVKISGLLDQIAFQADKLSKKVDIRELKEYKRLVSDFLDEAVNNSHKFMKENKLDKRGRHRVYALIKRVNDNLEGLTQEVLKEEKDNLLILQKLDDIRGLILDIVT